MSRGYLPAFFVLVACVFLVACSNRVGKLRAFSSTASLAQYSVERLPPLQVPKAFRTGPAQTVWSKVRLEDFSSEAYRVMFGSPPQRPLSGFSKAERVLLSLTGGDRVHKTAAAELVAQDNTPYTKISANERKIVEKATLSAPKSKKAGKKGKKGTTETKRA